MLRRGALAHLCAVAMLLVASRDADAQLFTPAGKTFPFSRNSMTVADFNGDGKPDIAITSGSSIDPTVTVLLGDGHAGFVAAPGGPYAVGNNPWSIVAGDFNGDGKLDMAIACDGAANNLPDSISVYLGDGHGGFTPAPVNPIALPANTGPVTLALADLNGDGKLDMVSANWHNGTVGLFFGNGNGTFTAGNTVTVDSSPFSVAVADFNGDGKPDIAAVGWYGGVTILLGDGHGGFTPSVGGPFPAGSWATSIAVGDFNGDGKLDIAVANMEGYVPAVFNSYGNVTLLLGDGKGGLTAVDNGLLPVGRYVSYIVAADFNGDGKLDVAAVSSDNGTAAVLLGNGSGGFTPAAGSLFPYGAQSAAVADIDGDGTPDLVVGNGTILLNLSKPPALSLAASHTGSFTQGQNGVVYNLTVSNAAGAGPTNGQMVAVVETLPTGLTLAYMSGDGWTCSANTCTRSDSLVNGLSYPPITVVANVAWYAGTLLVNSATVSGGGGPSASANDSTTIIANPPVLNVSMTHAGNVTQGQSGTYFVTVFDAAGAGPTTGMVTVAVTAPSGLTLASLSGLGWACVANTCTRSDSLGSGSTYPTIAANVNVAWNAGTPLVSSATVSGGGMSGSRSANDTTIVIANPPVLNIAMSHLGNLTQGQNGATYNVTVSGAPGTGPTTAMVTVTDAVPSGLTFVSMAGLGWNCAANTCTRSDVLGSGSSYPPITVTVNVASNAPTQVTNQVTVSGGGSVAASAGDPALVVGSQCSYAIAPGSANSPGVGGSGTFAVTAPTGCVWTASADTSWIAVTAGASGNGTGVVGYSVASNAMTSPRSGTLTAAGQTFTVYQDGAGCSYSFSPRSASPGPSGGPASFSVTSPSGCPWTAVSISNWLTVTGGASGNGNGTVNYTVSANSATEPRTTVITVGNSAYFAVTQSASYNGSQTPRWYLSPPSRGPASVPISPWSTLIPAAGRASKAPSSFSIPDGKPAFAEAVATSSTLRARACSPSSGMTATPSPALPLPAPPPLSPTASAASTQRTPR